MPDEARIVYLLLVLIVLAPAGVSAVRNILRNRGKRDRDRGH